MTTATLGDGSGPGSRLPEHPIAACITAVQAALAEVVDAPCWSLSQEQIARLTRHCGHALAGLSELRLRLVAAAEVSDVPGRHGATSTAAWLAHEHRLAFAAAAADVRLANALDGRCEATRRALAAGLVNADQARVITQAIAALPKELGQEELAQAEAWLLQHADSFGPDELRRLGRRVWEVLDPDTADAREGQALEAEEAAARRTTMLTMRRRGDGTTAGRFQLPDAHADMLRTWLEAVSAPRRTVLGSDLGTDAEDHVTYPVRMGRALMALAEHLPVGGFPNAGQGSATITIDLDWERLRSELGAATLSSGTGISAGQARRLACNAGLLPLVLAGPSRILDAGSSQRLFDRYQRIALAKRDRGCVWPGCDRPPAWCEAHHLCFWSDGGPTDLANGCLLCVVHHHLAHGGEWRVVMAADGVPELIPPARVDAQRTPRRHERFRRRAPERKRE